jgi:hypothetical protein
VPSRGNLFGSGQASGDVAGPVGLVCFVRIARSGIVVV